MCVKHRRNVPAWVYLPHTQFEARQTNDFQFLMQNMWKM